MLKDYNCFGVYRDDNLTINVMLENPIEHSLSADLLVFSVTIEPRDKAMCKPEVGTDITFYITDESGHIYNTSFIPDGIAESTPYSSGERGYYSDRLYMYRVQA